MNKARMTVNTKDKVYNGENGYTESKELPVVVQTGLAQALDTSADKARYDECAKKLLAFKAIDAWILKCCTKEFAPYSVEYIMKHCLLGKAEVSEHAVHQDQLNREERTNGDEQMTMMNSESSSMKEGTVYFDVRFNAVLPGKKEPITLIINLEIQLKDKPGYELVTRGVYYCARMISEQHGTVFTGEHYEKLQKVYSIWICPSMAQCRQNGIFRYHIVEEAVLGKVYVEKEAYDLMEVMVLNLGEADAEAECGILDLLNTLFSSEVSPDGKKEILEQKYKIAMTVELEEEVQRMCNLSDAIENRGIEKGIGIGLKKGMEKGIEKGIEKGMEKGLDTGAFNMAVKLYRKGSIDIEDAAEEMNMTVEQFQERMNQMPETPCGN